MSLEDCRNIDNNGRNTLATDNGKKKEQEQKSRLVVRRGVRRRRVLNKLVGSAHSGYSIIGGPALSRGGTLALVFALAGKEGAGGGRFCLDKGNYSRGSGMPQWRVVNKQSSLITVTSYTPFRHQRGFGQNL